MTSYYGLVAWRHNSNSSLFWFVDGQNVNNTMAEAFLDFISIGKLDQMKELIAMNSKSQSTREDPSFHASNSRTYPGDVTKSELSAMKLSAKMCKKNNSIVSSQWIWSWGSDDGTDLWRIQICRVNLIFNFPLLISDWLQILNEMLQDGDMESGNLQLLKLNASFMIKSENSQFYTRGILTRRPLEHTPSALCPDSAKHSGLVEHLPLSAACPTCWSVQRLGKTFWYFNWSKVGSQTLQFETNNSAENFASNAYRTSLSQHIGLFIKLKL